ncbi:hypothetical protein ASD65_04830 [Microbacterium sp. Root61]|uniref:SDR family oxidoreductase n=1 Tax=Microbacterium sp. Root61 TaxID=1736570 RepID=UPI0006F8D119|nr:SDR family oxidoreductase [Microbacterium sp. Root61]KRA23820.1 hypothetical protein ASD65_04830 [Microbacterium sp. Root61]
MGLLDEKVIVITGGANGQGRAHAVASAREGADVVLLDLAPLDSAAFATTIALVEHYGGACLPLRVSVTDQAELDAAFQSAVDAFGRIDGVILNAGIHRSAPFWETSESDWDAVFDVNLKGAWRTAKAAAPHFIRQNDGGSIVMISSVDGYDPEVDSTAYGVSKTGILGLLKYVGLELAPFGVRVNGIAPGLIDTAMVQSQAFYDLLAGEEGAGTPQHLIEYAQDFVALDGIDLISPDEVANAAVFLNSSLSRTVTGAVIPVDGGHMILNRKK